MAEGYLSTDAEWLSPEEAGFIRLGLELLVAQADAAYGRGEPQHAATLLGRARRYALESPALTATFCRRAGGQLGCAEAEAGD